MRFNEKELSQFALSLIPDREGLLEKKGASRGQGYKQRWFRLKGNLLFYFRVDEFQDWKNSEVLGVIVLERSAVHNLHSPAQPFMFSLSFADDDSRHYMLRANSLEDQQCWIKAISMASYDGLRRALYELKSQIVAHTGKDPLSSRNLYIPSSASGSTNLQSISYTASALSVPRLPQRAGSATGKGPSTSDLPSDNGPHYELRLACNLLGGGKDLSTCVRVLHLSQESSTHYLPISVTEVVESSSAPSYSHAIILDHKTITSSSSGVVVFRVMAVNKPQETSETKPEDIKAIELGSSRCKVKKLIEAAGKEKPTGVKLKLSEAGRTTGEISITPTKINTGNPPLPPKMNGEVTAIDVRGSTNNKPFGLGASVMHSSVLRRFYFHISTSAGPSMIRVSQEMGESQFTVQVPLQLLKCFLREDLALLEELNYNTGALTENAMDALQHYQAFLTQTVVTYTDSVTTMDELADMFTFKSSTKKHTSSMQLYPTNLHIQKLTVGSVTSSTEKTYHITMCGCPADHASGFKNGGLKSLLLHSHPSFISYHRPPNATLVRKALETLKAIRLDMEAYKNLLYRGCGNTNPTQMTAAFAAMSAEIQKLLALMQSKVVQNAIDELSKARPTPAPAPLPPSSPSLPSSLTTTFNTPPPSPRLSGGGFSPNTQDALPVTPRDSKRLSRVLNTLVKCSCGKCSKCIPSPSDWVWNGERLVQVSNGDWKLEDSISSIQQNLVVLLDVVETAASKIVQQQHDAHAASAENVISTFKPTFVWSEVLIPMCSSLNQTVEGLFKLANSVLSFALVKLDAKCTKMLELRKRWDIVFCEALTILVTSFYATLCQYLHDRFFQKQIEEVGFFVLFEAFLSPLGDEYGVLEDLFVAVSELSNVKFQLAPNSNPDIKFDFHITGTREQLTVQFLLGSSLVSVLPKKGLLQGSLVGVVPVLFTQGVNETQQITVNVRQQMLLQEEVNRSSMEAVSSYTEKFVKLLSQEKGAAEMKLATDAKDNLVQLKDKYRNQKSTSVEFFINLQQVCRTLNGGRIASCIDGKDRTSMSVSLEECCLLRNRHRLKDDQFMKALEALRSGTHLDNCLKNTGHRKYQFSSHQLKLLPRILKPPWHLIMDQ